MTRQKPETEESPAYRFALAAAELAYNTRCENVVLLDLRNRSPVTEFFVLATGTSPRQMRTVVEEIRDLGKKMEFTAWQTSGLESGRWILVDCVSVVCHVFDADSRDFYDLELLWGDCPRIDWRKELGLPEAAEEPAAAAGRVPLREYKAEDEDALDEENPDEEELEEDGGDDAAVMVELPDESTGSNSVEFLEVDPPTRRRRRGGSIYPTPIEDEDELRDAQAMHVISERAGAEQSLDEDDRQRAAEIDADGDEESTSREDLPKRRGPVARRSRSQSAAAGGKPAVKRGVKKTVKMAAGKPAKQAAGKQVAGKKASANRTAAKKAPVKAGARSAKKSAVKKSVARAVTKKKPAKAKAAAKKPPSKKRGK